jgi:hypothetical protein
LEAPQDGGHKYVEAPQDGGHKYFCSDNNTDFGKCSLQQNSNEPKFGA